MRDFEKLNNYQRMIFLYKYLSNIVIVNYIVNIK